MHAVSLSPVMVHRARPVIDFRPFSALFEASPRDGSPSDFALGPSCGQFLPPCGPVLQDSPKTQYAFPLVTRYLDFSSGRFSSLTHASMTLDYFFFSRNVFFFLLSDTRFRTENSEKLRSCLPLDNLFAVQHSCTK